MVVGVRVAVRVGLETTDVTPVAVRDAVGVRVTVDTTVTTLVAVRVRVGEAVRVAVATPDVVRYCPAMYPAG
jgi:hypothetical protein